VGRFNKIGNREMYMNCAVVDVVPKGSNDNDDKDKKRQLVIPEPDIEKRDTQHANAAAQKALSSYPGLFVANLKSINDCVTKETQDVIFDTPGKSVQFADGQKSSAKPSFGKGKCTGKGSKSAGSSSPNSSSPPPSSPGGDNGQWQPSEPSKLSDGTNCNDGQYHPACYGGPDAQKAITADSTPTAKSTSLTPAQATAALNEQGQQQVSDVKTGGQPSPKVEEELDAYLKELYGNKHSKRAACKKTSHRPCQAPSRWIKRGECTWRCERKGRASTIQKTTPKQKQIEQKLQSLEDEMEILVKLVKEKKGAAKASAKGVRRQESGEEPVFHITSFPAGGAPGPLDAVSGGEEPTFQTTTFPFRGAPGGPEEHTFQTTSFPAGEPAPGTFQTTSFPNGASSDFLPTTLQPEDAAPNLLATPSAPIESAPAPAVSTTATPMSTLNSFLDYFSLLQTIMMDYIRNLTANLGRQKKRTVKIQGRQEEPSFSKTSLPVASGEAPGTLSTTSAPVTAVSKTSAPLDATLDLFLGYLSRLQTTMIECIRNLTASTAPTVIDVTPDVQAIPVTTKDPAAALDSAPRKPFTLPAAKRQLVPPAVSMAHWIDSLDLPLDVQDDPVFTGLRNLGLEWEALYDSLRPEGDKEDLLDSISPELEIEQFEQAPPRVHASDPFTDDNPVPSSEAVGPFSFNQTDPLIAPFPNTTSASNNASSDANPLQVAADEASFSAALAADQAQNTPPNSNSTSNSTSNLEPAPTITPESDAASLLPLFMGPGPVVPPGMSIDWPGPNKWPSEHPNEHSSVSNLENMPMLMNDLGPDSAQEVKEFFAELGKQNDTNDQGASNLEHMPMVVDDLGPETEEGVREFFANLDHKPVNGSDGDAKDGINADGDGGEGDDNLDDAKDGSNLIVNDLGPEGEKQVNDFIAKLGGVGK
jgi:hypothetical protein